ncbi:MAG: hypothetical protein AAF443_05940 [Chlamydiota bacterium]
MLSPSISSLTHYLPSFPKVPSFKLPNVSEKIHRFVLSLTSPIKLLAKFCNDRPKTGWGIAVTTSFIGIVYFINKRSTTPPPNTTRLNSPILLRNEITLLSEFQSKFNEIKSKLNMVTKTLNTYDNKKASTRFFTDLTFHCKTLNTAFTYTNNNLAKFKTIMNKLQDPNLASEKEEELIALKEKFNEQKQRKDMLYKSYGCLHKVSFSDPIDEKYNGPIISNTDGSFINIHACNPNQTLPHNISIENIKQTMTQNSNRTDPNSPKNAKTPPAPKQQQNIDVPKNNLSSSAPMQQNDQLTTNDKSIETTANNIPDPH